VNLRGVEWEGSRGESRDSFPLFSGLLLAAGVAHCEAPGENPVPIFSSRTPLRRIRSFIFRDLFSPSPG